jgi:Tol biopolymer transport system component/DNA-binding winged helix-turn-helix (wHTH) protein
VNLCDGPPRIVRFGPFVVDLHTMELRKGQSRIRLPAQSFQILKMLLEQPGELVSREELQKQLWATDSFGDFEHGLNAAVKRLRDALSDSADQPRYIETLPRRGYRFIGTTEPRGAPGQGSDGVNSEKSAPSGPTADATTGNSSFTKTAALGVLVAVVVISFVFVARNRKTEESRPAVAKELAILPFTAFKGQEISPSFSPDGSQIVFAWDGGSPVGNFDLYVKATGAESTRKLTNSPSEWMVPAWSPDGQTIAFARMADAESGIYSIPALGGPVRKLVQTRFLFTLPISLSWSPDGKELAYAANDVSFVLTVETGARRELRRPKECLDLYVPAFSPDGEWIAAGCDLIGSKSEILRLSRAGQDPRAITTVNEIPLPLTWSADSRHILFSRNSLWDVDVDRGEVRQLGVGPNAGQPVISRNGDQMAFVRSFSNSNIWGLDLAAGKKAVPRLQVSSTRTQQDPHLSPDGKRVVFESDRSSEDGIQEIWMSDINGENALQLTNFHALTGTPRWAPDGKQIAFDSRESGHAAIYRVSAEGRVPQKIETRLPACQPTWSRDGQWIYFESCESEEIAVYKVSISSGEIVRVSNGIGGYAQEAPDGTIYYISEEMNGEIHRIRNAGSKEDLLAGMPHMQYAVDWALSSTGIYFLDRTRPATVIRFYDFKTGKIEKVLEMDKPAPLWGGLSISADGKLLLYSQKDDFGSDIMLVKGFR